MNKYIKSPFNYVGGKYKLLDQIIPLFPKKIDIFYDIFSGGMNVALNVNAKKIVAIDNENTVIDFITLLQQEKYYIIYTLEEIVTEYGLDKENERAYLKLREEYNNKKINGFDSSIMLYLLQCHSFSNQIRFNNKGMFNLPFGKRTFNESIKSNLQDTLDRLQKINLKCLNDDFRVLYSMNFKKNDFVYLDPPYYNSLATYNENKKWNEQDEIDLHKLLDFLNEKGVSFALSNNTGYGNQYLEHSMSKYRTIKLKADYTNCNYQKKQKNKDNEILIVNY